MMTDKKFFLITFLLLFAVGSMITPAAAQDDQAVVQAVLFYSSSCPHCAQLIEEQLPPLFERFGNQLQIIGINLEKPEGKLYWEAVDAYEISGERQGVPTLIVGEHVLVGGVEIPEKFPTIIAEGLESGGIAWPDIPGLDEILIQATSTVSALQTEAAQESPTPQQAETETATPSDVPDTITPEEVKVTPTGETLVTVTGEAREGLTDDADQQPTSTLGLALIEEQPVQSDGINLQAVSARVRRDPLGNSLSILVLLGMMYSLYANLNLAFEDGKFSKRLPSWLVPALSVPGIIVAGYLSFVEITQTSAVCGPVGDCNTVQQSTYATLFGFLPVGVMGLLGYLAVILLWTLWRYGEPGLKPWAGAALWFSLVTGVIFSLYLTFLEPFVIGATCAWCLTSAVIITLQLWITSYSVDFRTWGR